MAIGHSANRPPTMRIPAATKQSAGSLEGFCHEVLPNLLKAGRTRFGMSYREASAHPSEWIIVTRFVG